MTLTTTSQFVTMKMMKKIVLLILCIVVITAGGIIWKSQLLFKTSHETKIQPTQESVTAKDIFAQLPVWTPHTWSNPQTVTTQTLYGNLSGVQTTSQVTSPQAHMTHFENDTFIKNLGFVMDNNLSADGPGSSVWGYKKTSGTQTEIVVFSYQTKPTSSNPNEPLQFNCPCTVTLTTFVSNPFIIK